jgi:hypothetical protein
MARKKRVLGAEFKAKVALAAVTPYHVYHWGPEMRSRTGDRTEGVTRRVAA